MNQAQGQRPQRAPFRLNTRQRIQRVDSGDVTMGSRISREIPRVGFLAGVMLMVEGDVTIEAGALDTLGPWNLVKRLTLNTNVGAANIYDTSGYGNFIVQNRLYPGMRGDSDAAGNATGDGGELHQFADGTDTVRLNYFIPVAVNDGPAFSTGLINLQAPEVRVSLDVEWANAITDVHSGASAPSLTYKVAYVYYEVPPPQTVKWPPLVLHRILEDVTPISQTGDAIYTVPRQGTLLQLMHNVRLNGTRNSADIDQLRLRINKTDDIYVIDKAHYDWLHTFRYSRLPTQGEILHDFFHADTVQNAGDMRDSIDSEAISTLESIVSIGSGATLGSNNNFLNSIRRVVQPLELG